MAKVIVVGAGPAGMMASIAAGQKGHQVTLIEKNKQVGKKLRITGNGRCNVTNTAPLTDLLSKIVSNPRFMYSALHIFSNQDMIQFLHDHGIRTKVEDHGRVFPVSNRAIDIIAMLVEQLRKYRVQICTQECVQQLLIEDHRVKGVLTNKQTHRSDVVIVTTGGLSYPVTGSSGDGFQWSRALGHTIQPLYPALVPIETDEHEDLQGLSVSDVHYIITDQKKKWVQDRGDILFTHYGISGPAILTASSKIGKPLKQAPLTIHMDVCFGQDVDRTLRAVFEKSKNKTIENALRQIYPSRLVPRLLIRAQIKKDTPVNQITKEQRKRLVVYSHDFTLTLRRLRGFEEAMVTQGGISTKEIDPSTMASKKIAGLKFAGEIIDLDALTGRYNLQIAWSTGFLAGTTIK